MFHIYITSPNPQKHPWKIDVFVCFTAEDTKAENDKINILKSCNYILQREGGLGRD